MSGAAVPENAAPRITLLVARARNGVIGRDNALPWRLPEDLAHFKRTTMGRAILMGRRTFESIGRALPGRRTIVVTGDAAWRAPDCERAGSLSEAITLAAASPSGGEPSIAADEVFVVGGARMFEEALPIAARALVTEIDLLPAGDVHFEAPSPPAWRLAHTEPHTSATGLRYRIDDWRRVNPATTGPSAAPPCP